MAVVSANRVAIMQELRGEDEPGLDEILTRLEGSELILVEGFKAHDHAKIEEMARHATVQCNSTLPSAAAIAAAN